MPRHNIPTIKPLPAVATTEIEAALVAAWEEGGQQAIDDAEQEAVMASDRLERQGGELATANRVAELRTLLIELQQAVARHHFLAALANGEEPEALPGSDNHWNRKSG